MVERRAQSDLPQHPRQKLNQAAPAPSAWSTRMACTLCLVLAVLIVYAPAAAFDFVRWDDDINVYNNPYLHPVSLASVRHFWLAPYQQLYVPLSYTVWAILAKIASTRIASTAVTGGVVDLDPHVFHCANIALHLANVLLVFSILRLLTRKDIPAAAGALLFAIHPLQVEAVCWISELRGLLCGLFSLLALWSYLKFAMLSLDNQPPPRRWRFCVLAVIVFLCALLSKPTAVVIPLLAFCLDMAILKRRFGDAVLCLAVALALCVPFGLATHSAQPVPHALEIAWPDRLVVAADSVAFYAAKFFAPVDLVLDYGRSPEFVLAHSPWLGLAVVAAIGAMLAILVLRRRPTVPLALTMFVIAILPVLGLEPFVFQRYSTVADRYAYLGMLGPAIAVALMFAATTRRRHRLAFAAGIIALAALSVQQVRYWRDSVGLFRHTLAVNPKSSFTLLNLGTVLFDRGNLTGAVDCYRRGLAVSPSDEKLNLNLGLALFDEGRVKESVTYLSNAARIDVDNAQAHNDLGVALASLGQRDAAIREWKIASYLQPGYDQPRQNLADALK